MSREQYRKEYLQNKDHYRSLGLSMQDYIDSRLIDDGHEQLPMAGVSCLPYEEEKRSLECEETAEKIRNLCKNLDMDHLADSAIEMNQTLSQAKKKIRQVAETHSDKTSNELDQIFQESF